MKASFILAAIANIALVIAFPVEKDIIAKRQVNTAQLRSGTRRLSARQAGPSPGRQSNIISEFINCPASIGLDVTIQTSLSGEMAIRTVAEGGDSVRCFYSNAGNCAYNGDTGALLQGGDNAEGACPSSLVRAVGSQSPNDLCFQGCPRQQNGLFYASSQLTVAGGNGETRCAYSATMFGPGGTSCQFNARDGSFIQGNGLCPISLDRSAFCVNNVPGTPQNP